MKIKHSKQIRISESTTVEWKQSLATIDEMIKTAAAFANAEGGRIFIGISKKGEVVGIQIGKGTLENLVNRIGQHTDPMLHPKVTVKKVGGKDVIVVEVKESHDHLVLAFGRPYKRVGRSTVKMSKDEYERLIYEKYKYSLQFDEMICKGASLKDIDDDKVFRFLNKAKKEKRLVVPENTTLKDSLLRLNLIKNGKLNNTAILLFGKDPQKFFVQAKIRAARFKGADSHDYIDMKVFDGAIQELREKALAFIAEHTRHAVFFDANQRFDKWEYPIRALEEMLNNALAHRDYWSNANIHLAIYDDRIEVWNPGELPEPLTPAMLKRKHNSIPRNGFLADRLFYIRYIEHWGRGTNRIMEAMREEKLSDPVFEELSGGLNVTLIGPGKSFEKAIEDQKLHKLDLNERQKKAMEYVKENGSIKRSEYMKLGGISHKTAHLELKEMVNQRIFIQQGRGPSTRYVIYTG